MLLDWSLRDDPDKRVAFMARAVKANLGLVYNVARKYVALMPFDDLVQEGVIGLMKAVIKYDPGRGCKFSSMAVPWIQREIQTGCVNGALLVRIPNWRWSWSGKIRYGEGESGFVETITLLDKFHGDTDGEFRHVENRLRPRWLLERLSRLTDRERAIVDMRFGLDGGYGATFAAIGRHFNVSRERIRQIVMRCLGKMREVRE